MNVLVINGHPRTDSLSTALTSAYLRGAAKAGAVTKCITVSELAFDPNVTHHTPHLQRVEPCIKEAQDLILWADHVVFVYPTWWGTMPALLKGFIDRVLTSGFAFEEIEGGTGYAPLLRGRSAQIITTMDTPLLVYKLFYHAPGHNAMRYATLGFCGFAMAKTLSFGPVKKSDLSKRKTWLDKAETEGSKLKRGSLSSWKQAKIKLGSWIKAVRLQFYPMTLIAYAAGAAGAAQNGYGFDKTVFWLGYTWIFFLELATVLSNEYFDFRSDKQNKFFSPFTGGSRVLVDGLVKFKEIKAAVFVSLTLSLTALLFLTTMVNFPFSIIAILALLFLLAMGYTVPPLKLSYRGLGELTVGITHSFAVIFCGYVFQGGYLADSFSWLLSLPLFLSVLPSILLAGIPDRAADKMVEKNTVAVRVGARATATLAILFTILSVLTVAVFSVFHILPVAFKGMLYVIVPHAALLIYLLYNYIKTPVATVRIDALIITALTYLTWFAVIPLVNLW